MPFTNSQMGQIVGVIPDGTEEPNVPLHLQGIVNAIEKKLVLRVNSTNDITSPENGMFAVTASAVFVRLGGQWVQLYPVPTILSGTSAPSSGQGNNGDLYVQYVA